MTDENDLHRFLSNREKVLSTYDDAEKKAQEQAALKGQKILTAEETSAILLPWLEELIPENADPVALYEMVYNWDPLQRVTSTDPKIVDENERARQKLGLVQNLLLALLASKQAAIEVDQSRAASLTLRDALAATIKDQLKDLNEYIGGLPLTFEQVTSGNKWIDLFLSTERPNLARAIQEHKKINEAIKILDAPDLQARNKIEAFKEKIDFSAQPPSPSASTATDDAREETVKQKMYHAMLDFYNLIRSIFSRDDHSDSERSTYRSHRR